MIISDKGICCQKCGKLLINFGKVRVVIPALNYQCECGAVGSFELILVDKFNKKLKKEERRIGDGCKQ